MPPPADAAAVAEAAQPAASSSSSSHAPSQQNHRILTLYLERRSFEEGALVRTSTSHLYLVDLAGADNFDFEGSRAGRWVNRGVLAVGRVVMALANDQPHVPYRDYPVTELFASILQAPRTTCAP